MIDYFTIALTHGLILVALWRMTLREDLDRDDPAELAAARMPAAESAVSRRTKQEHRGPRAKRDVSSRRNRRPAR